MLIPLEIPCGKPKHNKYLKYVVSNTSEVGNFFVPHDIAGQAQGTSPRALSAS